MATGKDRLESFGIYKIARQLFDDFNGANAVRDFHDFLRINVVLLCPPAPLASDRAGRVDEHSIKIKEDGSAVECFHGQVFFANFAAFVVDRTSAVRCNGPQQSRIMIRPVSMEAR